MAKEAAEPHPDPPARGGPTLQGGILGAYEAWIDYLRLFAVTVWLLWTLAFKPDRVLLWVPLALTEALSVFGIVATKRGWLPTIRRPFVVVVNIVLLTYFVWAVGAESTTLTVFYVPIIVAVTMAGSPAASKVGVVSAILAYAAVVLLQRASLLPVAPLVSPELRHKDIAGGPVLPILSVATAVLGSYTFVLLARRRLERQARTERVLQEAQKRAEGENRELQRQLELSQRMEGMGRLAGGIAHDFNNVLTAIVSNVTVARDAIDSHSSAHRDLGEALECARHAGKVVRQILAFSHRDAGEVAVVDLPAVVGSARELLSRAIRPGVRIEISEEQSPPHVEIDPTRLEQVLLNLAVNASDAMGETGTISICLAQETLDESASETWPRLAPGRYARITVRDDGAGMDEATLARALDPFFTTKEREKGSGIGLSIVYSIIHTSGGGLRLQSAPGVGTTVTILLPATNRPLAPVAKPAAVADTACGTVLLVEDRDDVRRATSRLLDRRGYRVLAASSGEEALRAAAQEGDGIDVLLSDVVMPGMSGVTLARQLRKQRPRLQVLLMSGHTDSDISGLADLREAVQFVSKPFEPVDLIARVAAAVSASKAGAA